MGGVKFTEALKQDAVKKTTELGYSVPHSLIGQQVDVPHLAKHAASALKEAVADLTLENV